MDIRDSIRRDHRKLWGYPSLMLGLWLGSLALTTGGVWFIQDWRYGDLQRSMQRDAGNPVYYSTGQMQVVTGENAKVYMTSDDADDSAEYATEERRYRDRHPFENAVRFQAQPSGGGHWGASSSSPRPDFRPLQ